jgi:hypothetical protein
MMQQVEQNEPPVISIFSTKENFNISAASCCISFSADGSLVVQQQKQ